MAHYKRGAFEREWQEAFAGKEVSPSPELWDRIDGALYKDDHKKSRVALVWWRWAAAASITLAIVAGGWSYTQYNDWKTEKLAYENKIKELNAIVQKDFDEGTPSEKDIEVGRNSMTVTENKSPRKENSNNPELNIKTIEQNANIIAGTSLSDKNNGIIPKSEYTAQEIRTGGKQNSIDLRNEKSEKTLALSREVDSGQTAETGDKDNLLVFDNNEITSGSKERARNGNNDETQRGRETDQESYAIAFAPPDEIENNRDINTGTVYDDMSQPVKETGKEDVYSTLSPDNQGLLGSIESMGLTFLDLTPVKMEKVYIFYPDMREVDEKRNIWGGMTLAGGSFDPSGSSGTLQTASLAEADVQGFNTFNTRDSGSNTFYSGNDIPGRMMSVGLSAGTELGKRWVFSGGLNFINANSGAYYGSLSYADAKSVERALYQNTIAETYNIPSTIVENMFNYVSIPVRLGFKIMDERKVDILVSSGVSSSFLANTVSQTHNADATATYSAPTAFVADDSGNDYRIVNLWGTLSTELNYSLGDHYVMSLVPSYRLGLNALRKSDKNLPSMAEIGFGLRYVFN
ncbi:MAG: hypothetical protein OEX02_11425 [Cyclobacteriaceae bacterium]|nr:hypothetical protein [Cyclobacteriaceae bacterium]